MKQRSSFRERYRVLVSWLIIPLGLIIMVRGSMVGFQAWTLIVLGLAFVGLGIVRLRAHYGPHMHSENRTLSRRKQV
jgi:hypothetical protein